MKHLFQKSLLIAVFLFNSMAFAWQQMPGKAHEIAVGGKNQLWVIGADPRAGGYGIYQWLGNNWAEVDGGGISIAVDRFGRPWVVNSAGEIYFRKQNQWARVEGRAHQIAIGGLDQLWMLGRDRAPGGFSIYKRWQGRWVKMEGGAVRIAVDSNGLPWVVNNRHEIFSYNNGHWVQLPGLANDIAAGGNAIWVVGANRRDGGFDIYFWNGRTWEVVEGGAMRISVDRDGNPLVINNNLDIFAY